MDKRSFQVQGETLGAIELFADLDLAARSELAALCQGRRFAAGEVILSAREESTDVFFIISGELRITVFSAGGKQVTFNDKEAGSTFGELAALDGRPRSAHVIAVSDAALAQLPAAGFNDVLTRYPAVAARMLKLLALQVRRLSERVIEFSTVGVNDRVHAELLRLAQGGQHEGEEIIIAPAPTHADIASRVATHREAVTKELSRLTREGILRKGKGTLVITDLSRLEELVAGALGDLPDIV